MDDVKKQIAKTVNEKELETLAFWQAHKIFEKSVETPAGGTPLSDFSFYDGPPFATGLPHHGHILAGTIKDAIPRYQTMQGKRVRRMWGWDCHGLPVENLIEKKLKLASKKDIESYGVDKFNKEAYDSVLEYDSEWKKIIPRLGRWVDMEHPYKTMDSTYTESVWWSFSELHKKGLAYEGSKMMHICPRCETPLAQSEVGLEYHDVTDLSVTAKFELVDEPGTYVLAWTTTPWTLPGNTALAVNKSVVYAKMELYKKSVIRTDISAPLPHEEKQEGVFIIAKNRKIEIEAWLNQIKSDVSFYFKIVEEFTGEKLVGKNYSPVFPYFIDKEMDNKENLFKIWHADFITEDAGTGIAHESPAFGAEDMELAKTNNIPIIKHVKMDGTFTADVTDFFGMKVKVAGDTQSADIEIIKYLAHDGKLFEKHKIIHSYPLCWRCKTPLLNYATSSWFIDVPKIKEKLISENKNIGWTPEHVREGRFGKWLEGAREWAVSRLRYWGAPLPVWKSESGKVKVISSLKELASLTTAKSKNTYYVMRHGQSLYNTQAKLDSMGVLENVLTEAGREKISCQIESVKNAGVDVIYASPLPRTKETASILGEAIGVPIFVNEKLSEFTFGEFEGKSSTEFHARSSLHTYLDEKVEGGDSFRELSKRFMQSVADCEVKHERKTILFVTHGSNAYMGRAEAELWTDEEIIKGNDELTVRNGELIKIKVSIVPRDETGSINVHRPYIDQVELMIEGEVYKRIPDVFDCWYESGSMPYAQLHYPFENKETFDKNFPADFIAEGLDQTRGWFYSLINLGVGVFDKAPYKHVIVNGTILADDGQKMSKSEKNYTDPMELVNKFGADAIRYFLLSSPAVKGENMEFHDKGVEDVYKKLIMRLENVVSLYVMNAGGDTKVTASADSKNVLDRWILARLYEVLQLATKGYDDYKLDEATRPLEQFIDDLSVWYVRRSRDRLKGGEGEKEKRESLATMKCVLLELSKVMAPVMPFLAERVYKEMGGEKESVHLEKWSKTEVADKELITKMQEVRDVVSEALMLRTKEGVSVRQSLQSLSVKSSLGEEYNQIIKDEINVKEIKVGTDESAKIAIDFTLTPTLIREGDIRNLMRAVQDTRKEKGMTQGDMAKLTLTLPLSGDEQKEIKKICNLETVITKEVMENAKGLELSSGNVSYEVSL